MLNKFLRENKYAALALLLLRIYVGWEWINAAYHKLTGGFDAAGFMKNALAKPVVDTATKELVYPNYVAFLKHFALPHVDWFNVLIPIGELLVGLGLIVGALTTAAAFFGMMMNFMFLFAGTVSTNPWLILLGVIVFIAGANAGRFGVDYYLLPLLRKAAARLIHRDGTNGKAAGGRPAPAHA